MRGIGLHAAKLVSDYEVDIGHLTNLFNSNTIGYLLKDHTIGSEIKYTLVSDQSRDTAGSCDRQISNLSELLVTKLVCEIHYNDDTLD